MTLEQIKKCPKCGFLIKKNKGCNHMTCGNPICRYEFCWLCMKEAVPNHFDYGPCAGKQFFDPDSFSYKLQQNHPYLFCIYYFLIRILLILFLVIAFLVAPGLGLSFFAYETVFESDSFNHSLDKQYLKYIMLMMCIFQSFCIQSIIYMAWGLVLAALGIVIGIFILSIIFSILKCIFKCLFCCFDSDDAEQIDINIGQNDLELGNNINDNKENKAKIEEEEVVLD